MASNLAQRNETQLEPIQNGNWLEPAIDLYENNNEWLIVADLPGVKRDNLKLRFGGNELSIEGRREKPADGARSEVGKGSFWRTFQLPAGIEADNVSADFKHGVVSIHMPKPEAIKPRRVEVKSG